MSLPDALQRSAVDHRRARRYNGSRDRQDDREAHARCRPSRVTRSRASAPRPRRIWRHGPSASSISVEEGPRIYIERINIIGNTRTKDYVIRREFRLAEGDAYNPLHGRSRQEAPAGPGPLQVGRDQAPPWLGAQTASCSTSRLWSSPRASLSFGAGYSTSEGVIGDVSITERNLLGNGQFLRLKLAGSFDPPAG